MAGQWRCLKPSSIVSHIVPHTTHTAFLPAHPYSPYLHVLSHVLSQFDEGLIRNQILRSYDTVNYHDNYTVNDAAGNVAGNSASNATEGKPIGSAGFW
jgi:hypothetical protein